VAGGADGVGALEPCAVEGGRGALSVLGGAGLLFLPQLHPIGSHLSVGVA